MKIEKDKLYYDTRTNQFFKAAYNYEGIVREGITNKIAVYCPTKDDKLYVAKKYGLEWVEKNACINEPYVDLADDYILNVNYSGFTCYHIITIDQFKEFYPPVDKEEQKELTVESSNSEPYDGPYNWVNNVLEADSKKYSTKTDIIVQNVVKKYQERSEVGIKKYNTTLQENSDGVDVFLNHLQEELMDATLYIEKLKQQVKQLKEII